MRQRPPRNASRNRLSAKFGVCWTEKDGAHLSLDLVIVSLQIFCVVLALPLCLRAGTIYFENR